MPTISDLRQLAATIKNATQVGENTANRVGGTFETVADLLEQAGGGGQGIPSVDLSQLNALRTPADQTDANPTVYNVTTMHTLSGTTIKVGTLFVFSDGARVVVTQVLVSNYQVDGGGSISSPNASQITIYYRMFNIVQETWSAWTLYAGGSGGGGTIDPYPVSGSDNAVASNGVFERLQENAPKVDISAIDDIDEYSDMLATKSPYYIVTKTIRNNVFRIGTLMEFANQGRYILYQILATDYVLNEDGTLDTVLSQNGDLKLIWRMKQFSSNPPEGVVIGEWSKWSYLSGGGGGEVDAYTKTETDTLLAQKQNVLTFDNVPTANSNNPVKSGGVKTELDGKVGKTGNETIAGNKTFTGSIILNDLAQLQEGNRELQDVLDEIYQRVLTFDNAPTDGSDNPVKSGGIYDYLIDLLSAYIPATQFATINGSSITQGGNIQVVVPQGAITIDAAPTSGSQNAVSSGGAYDAIEGGFYY